MNDQLPEIFEHLKQINTKAYCKYSYFPVSAAIQWDSNRITYGINVENSSIGLTVCAERHAVGAGILEGESRVKRVFVYSQARDFLVPCGACRQVLTEFGDEETEILMFDQEGNHEATTLGAFLPGMFRLEED
ncbi:cytidine deaminase [Algicola sagamiensis]|uniref:cytidine deaminase n=1 Tax=Algicola sagamiensis TaxID=163869 RepID=UPI00068660C6|nr:cytidine deaminase [Algicola sagamiensis]